MLLFESLEDAHIAQQLAFHDDILLILLVLIPVMQVLLLEHVLDVCEVGLHALMDLVVLHAGLVHSLAEDGLHLLGLLGMVLVCLLLLFRLLLEEEVIQIVLQHVPLWDDGLGPGRPLEEVPLQDRVDHGEERSGFFPLGLSGELIVVGSNDGDEHVQET
jgi:hypothetical protein